MSTATPWRDSIDDTLRSTQETLARLNNRHNDFDHAKRRLAEAFPEEASYAYGRNGQDSPDVRRDMPPPLPSSYINTLRYPATEVGSPARSLYVKDSGYGNDSPNRRYNGNDVNPVPRVIKELSDDYALVKAQLKNAQVELELERSVRADQVKHLEVRFGNQVGELRACIQQLRDDNTYLREALRATERHNALDAGAKDRTAIMGSQNDFEAAKKKFLLSESLPPTVYERLTQVEEDVAKQQRNYEDRQGRLENLMVTTVKNKVEVEVERMRSIAREAARDGCEELIKLRLSAVQQMFGDELHRVMENTGVSREIAETTKELFRKMEGELERKVFSLEGQIGDLRKEAQFNGQKQKADLQHVLDNELHQVKQDILTTQNEQREAALRLSQTMTAKMDATKVDLSAKLTAALEEKLSASALVREADVRRLIDNAVTPVDRNVEAVQATLDKMRDTAETNQKQGKLQLELMQKSANALHDDVYDCKTLLKDQGETQDKLREELDAVKGRQKEAFALLQQTADTANDAKSLSVSTEKEHSERLQTLESQLRPMKNEQEAIARKMSQVANTSAVLEERTASCENKLIDIEGSVTRATQPLKVKVESIQSLLSSKIQPAMDDLAVFPATINEKLASLDSKVVYQEKLSAQRASDATRDSDLKLREVESALRREVQEASQQVVLQKEAIDKKVLGLKDEVKRIWDRIGTSASALASREDVDKAIAQLSSKLLAVTSAVEAEMDHVREGLASQASSPKNGPSADGASPVTAMSPVKMELLDHLSNEIETVREMVQEQARSAQKTAQQVQACIQAKEGDEAAHNEAAWKQALAEAVRKLQDEWNASVDGLHKEVHAKHVALEEKIREAIEERPEVLKGLLTSKLTTAAVVQLLLQSGDDDMKMLAARMTQASGATAVVEDSEGVKELRRIVSKLEQQQSNMCKDQRELDEETKTHADDIEREKKMNQQRWRQLQERVARLEEELSQQDDTVTKALLPVKAEWETQNAQAAERVEALEEKLKEMERTVAATESQCRDLSTMHQTVVPPAVNEKIRVLLDTLASEQESHLQPLRLKLKGVEERQRQLDSEHAELTTAIGSQNREVEKKWQAQLDKLREETTSHCTLLCDAVEGRMQAKQLEKEKSLLDRMQATVAPLQDRLETMSEPLESMRKDVDAVRQKQQALKAPDSSDDTKEAIRALQERQAALEKWTEYIENSASEGLQSTGDALRILRDSLHSCISRVAAEAAASGHSSGPNDRAVENSAVANGSMQSLGDILHYFLHGIHTLQHTTNTLSTNAVSTLSVLENLQHEVLPVPHLQRAVVHISSHLAPIATAHGVGPQVFHVDVGPVEQEEEEPSEPEKLM